MVDSTKGTTMADGIDDLAKRVQTVEGKMDNRSASIDTLAGSVAELTQVMNQRFDHVATAIAEQRRYTEFAHLELGEKMDAGFGPSTIWPSTTDDGVGAIEVGPGSGLMMFSAAVG